VVIEALARTALTVRRLVKEFEADPGANWDPGGFQQMSALAAGQPLVSFRIAVQLEVSRRVKANAPRLGASRRR
jgi:hypothetical protein